MSETDELKAWKPWNDSLTAYRELTDSDSPGDHPHWRIYWIAGVALLRAIGHVLAKVDTCRSPLHASVVSDLWANVKKQKPKIFHDFIERERNNLLKVYTTDVIVTPVTNRGWADEDLTYDQLVARYGERKVLSWTEEGEDALRIFRIGLEWWEMNLRAIEQSIREEISNPFSGNSRRNWELTNASFKYRKRIDY